MNGLSHSSTHAARVGALALDIVERLPVPAAASLGSALTADVRADAVVAVWRAAERDPGAFRDADGDVGRDSVEAYLRVALRAALDELRAERRRRHAHTAAAAPACAPDTLAVVVARDLDQRAHAALRTLAPADRAVVVRRMAGWSFARIAADLGLRRNTAIQRYRRARARLPEDALAALPAAHERGR